MIKTCSLVGSELTFIKAVVIVIIVRSGSEQTFNQLILINLISIALDYGYTFVFEECIYNDLKFIRD